MAEKIENYIADISSRLNHSQELAAEIKRVTEDQNILYEGVSIKIDFHHPYYSGDKRIGFYRKETGNTVSSGAIYWEDNGLHVQIGHASQNSSAIKKFFPKGKSIEAMTFLLDMMVAEKCTTRKLIPEIDSYSARKSSRNYKLLKTKKPRFFLYLPSEGTEGVIIGSSSLRFAGARHNNLSAEGYRFLISGDEANKLQGINLIDIKQDTCCNVSHIVELKTSSKKVWNTIHKIDNLKSFLKKSELHQTIELININQITSMAKSDSPITKRGLLVIWPSDASGRQFLSIWSWTDINGKERFGGVPCTLNPKAKDPIRYSAGGDYPTEGRYGEFYKDLLQDLGSIVGSLFYTKKTKDCNCSDTPRPRRHSEA